MILLKFYQLNEIFKNAKIFIQFIKLCKKYYRFNMATDWQIINQSGARVGNWNLVLIWGQLDQLQHVQVWKEVIGEMMMTGERWRFMSAAWFMRHKYVIWRSSL